MYELNGVKYPVIINKKKNKHTYIKVKDGNIHITTNYLMSSNMINKILIENKKSIDKMILRHVNREKKNQEFYYLGHKYDIIIMSTNNVEIIDNKIYAKDLKKLNSWYKEQMINLFNSRLYQIYNMFEENIDYPILKIRTMTTRWGVCNHKSKTITLNSKLMRYEVEYIDYVIVHELCHLVHPNHSIKFWSLVGKYCPDYKRIRSKLKE